MGRGKVLRVAMLIVLAAACSRPAVSSAPSGGWPNEPAGLTMLSEWGFDHDPPTAGDVPIPGGSGWSIVSQAPAGSARGWAQRVSDPGAPISPASVYDFVFPKDMVEGNAPATVYYRLGRGGFKALLGRVTGEREGATEMYVGFWWKPSSPFDTGPNGNKIAFLFNGGGATGGQQFIILMPDGRLHVLPEYPGDYRWRRPNVNATAVKLGAWHRVEWYCDLSSGTLKWWLDGMLQGSHGDVKNAYDFDMFQFSPTWGGNTGARKRETDHYWFDQVHLSVRERS